ARAQAAYGVHSGVNKILIINREWTPGRVTVVLCDEAPGVLAMPESRLGVGIIGVSPVRGWAATAHIPALRALLNYQIRALSARNAETARAAGDVFGVSA